jgi:hypothetical protein
VESTTRPYAAEAHDRYEKGLRIDLCVHASEVNDSFFHPTHM